MKETPYRESAEPPAAQVGQPDHPLVTSWAFPSFAREFPRHDELDRLVAAFAKGDYRAVNDGATKLIASEEGDAVKAAARTLAERTRPDPASRTLFLVTGALLALLTGWWVAHDGPPADAPPAPTSPVPTVEYVK